MSPKSRKVDQKLERKISVLPVLKHAEMQRHEACKVLAQSPELVSRNQIESADCPLSNVISRLSDLDNLGDITV